MAGKNRPLDEDELDFLERVRSQQRARERLDREQDAAELDAYQLVSGASHGLLCHLDPPNGSSMHNLSSLPA